MVKKKHRMKELPDHPDSIVYSAMPSLRKECSCEAKKHNLINNCLHCGRIVCEQEGSGPCFTCQNLVCTNEQRNKLDSDSPSAEALHKRLLGTDFSLKSVGKMVFGKDYPAASEAIEHKNKLLEFDRTARKQTKVIDDQGDHYHCSSNKWLTMEQRRVLMEKSYKNDPSHSDASFVTIDFAGRKILEEEVQDELCDIEELLEEDESIHVHSEVSINDVIYGYHPQYCDTMHNFKKPVEMNKKVHLRIQDKELQCMSDEGKCLSVHQPHASLIISGIKKHEGRNWYTNFRGRLWIHAAAKMPGSNDILAAEAVYKTVVGNLEFPKNYPTGCLLGCVELADCLSQEEYTNKIPMGTCGSPFVFLCENPQEMKVKIPMKGGRQIFKLDSKIHKAAKRTLQKLH